MSVGNVNVTLKLTDFIFQKSGKTIQSHEKLNSEVVVQDGVCLTANICTVREHHTHTLTHTHQSCYNTIMEN